MVEQVHPEIVDKLLATIQEQAKEIGKLEQTITQLRSYILSYFFVC